ncbi:MAG: hypothetical protein COA74_14255 [Gammaproteobacteria bacterium]|nr:MAG: hypothetical protein COA74_14255 [Gammaproteobacteria bacterium]
MNSLSFANVRILIVQKLPLVFSILLLITLISFFIPTGNGINKDYFSLQSRWQMQNSGIFTQFYYASDANSIVYVAKDKNTFSQLYLYNVVKNSLSLLTKGDFHHDSPVISNDNNSLYYRKHNASECAINHLDLYTREVSFVYPCKNGIKDFNLDISPDNNLLIISERFINQTQGAVIFDLTHLKVTDEVIFEADLRQQLSTPVFSPSGNQVAFIIRKPVSNSTGILLYHLLDKQWTPLNVDNLTPSNLTWGKNDSELYFSNNQQANQGIWFTTTEQFSKQFTKQKISSNSPLDIHYDRKNDQLIIVRNNLDSGYTKLFLTTDVLIESWNRIK